MLTRLLERGGSRNATGAADRSRRPPSREATAQELLLAAAGLGATGLGLVAAAGLGAAGLGLVAGAGMSATRLGLVARAGLSAASGSAGARGRLRRVIASTAGGEAEQRNGPEDRGDG